jgi:hypothetical protein
VKAFVIPMAVVGLAFLLTACEQQTKSSSAKSHSTTMKPEEAAGADEPRILGLDPGWVLANGAEYTASQAPNEEVTIRATGNHPTAGYETKFVVSPLRIYPPQWLLAVKRPDGPVAQVVTPFDVSASFKASNQIATLRVTDALGQHDVHVEQED